jgi:hypothetical protein
MEARYLVRPNGEGQIAGHWGAIDTLGAMGQTGLLPPPG